MDIESIIKQKEAQIADEKLSVSAEEMKAKASDCHNIPLDLEKALKKNTLALIAPISKACPIQKATRHHFGAHEMGREFEKDGCDALMISTEKSVFLGEVKFIEKTRDFVDIPIILHDFIVDPYQIYQALTLGADAIVLMPSILDADMMMRFKQVAEDCGLNWIAEVQNAQDIQTALECAAQFIMIQNEPLNGTPDLTITQKLATFIPEDITLISHGAIHSLSDIETVCSWGANAAVPNVCMLTSANTKEIVRDLRAFGSPKPRVAKPLAIPKQPEDDIDFPSLKDIP